MRRILLIVLTALTASALCHVSATDSRTGEPGNSVTGYTVASKTDLPHDMAAYTQGFFFHDGFLYESTGQYGESSFRKVDPATGKVLREENFPSEYFAEGSCVFDGRAYILTWYEGVCFVYDIETFTKLAELPYQGQGWGLTTDGESLIMSDGSSELTFRDPDTFLSRKTLRVMDGTRPVYYLNELEYIDGHIWANIYGQDMIVIIDPASGQVSGKIDCRGLLDSRYRTSAVDVLNGIAFNPEDGAIYLTGKYWPRMYKVTLRQH